MEPQVFLSHLSESLNLASPLMLLLGLGLLLLILDAFGVTRPLPWITGLGLAASAALAQAIGPAQSTPIFFGMMEAGGIAPLVHVFLSLSGLFTLFFLGDYLKRHDQPVPEVYALLVFAVLGMSVMANANDLIMTFIGLETMSMSLYIFAALYKTKLESNEAGLKYFLLGSFASAFLLFGISLIYGLTGYTNFDGIAANLQSSPAADMMFFTAMGLILIGFLFKVAAFPFHSWAPDVYQGTPTPLAGFMATGSKLAAFVALAVIVQKFDAAGSPATSKIYVVLAAAALLTMIYGNIVAARQQNIKRMLAYSSIAHTGYVLLGVCAAQSGFEAILFYLFVYTLMNIGAFGMVGMLERDYEDNELSNWRGLGAKAPYFAVALSVFLFSLTGIPPLAGFWSKYVVFVAAIDADLLILATIGILTSVIGAYYYIRVIVVMFFSGDKETPQFNLKFATAPVIGAAILIALVVIYGAFPSLLLTPIHEAFAGLPEYSASLLPF